MPRHNESNSPPIARLKRRAEYVYVRGGLSERRRSVVVQARRRQGRDEVGLGFTATKKIGGAVVRNRAKRRLRSAAYELADRRGLAGVDYVFIARRDTAEVAWQRLLDDMESALISLADALSEGAASA